MMFDWKILHEVVDCVKDLTKAIREATEVYKLGLEKQNKEQEQKEKTKNEIRRFY